ncbi:hypothetical protein BpHYR1_001464 [Brachionus plicatilis]|uniref:Uncharacterized protein n=1 Tax=Brachionus plicatilis TaxID=10195 RepID=A0A3M7PSC1_BRAPC|nr:hypothetical protein BpHYR1_001464 [Brachionus plicatilis]
MQDCPARPPPNVYNEQTHLPTGYSMSGTSCQLQSQTPTRSTSSRTDTMPSGLDTIPLEIKNLPMGEKRKRGAPKKATKALVRM